MLSKKSRVLLALDNELYYIERRMKQSYLLLENCGVSTLIVLIIFVEENDELGGNIC